jgi:Tol biopolymer transport system component
MSEQLIVYSKALSSSSTQGAVTCAFYQCTQWGTTNSEAGIAVKSFDGEDERVLTRGGYDNAPTFSPDGHTIAYLRHIQGPGDHAVDALAFMASAGLDAGERVPPMGKTYIAPAWSPDGRSVAVTAFDSGVHSRGGKLYLEPPDQNAASVQIMPLDGSPVKTIATGAFQDLAWSHDGRWIAASRHHLDPRGNFPGNVINTTGTDLWILSADGSTPPRQLTHLAPAHQGEGAACGRSFVGTPQIGSPAWSPDDTRLAALSSYGHREDANAGVRDVVVVNADGGGFLFAYSQPPACTDDASRVQHLELIRWR